MDCNSVCDNCPSELPVGCNGWGKERKSVDEEVTGT